MGLLARLFGWLRRRPQQPVLDERDAYERCHGRRVAEIRIVPVPPPTPRVLPRLGGDYLRGCFEKRLESRHRKTANPLELLRVETVAAARKSGNDGPLENGTASEAEPVAQAGGARLRDP
jgi:hypothetical protein